LDGGHLLFLLVEKIKGAAVSAQVQERAALVGMTVLLGLALFISFHDIKRYFFKAGPDQPPAEALIEGSP
jgi:regulator of sigma E protease